jgi:hypothetical protein
MNIKKYVPVKLEGVYAVSVFRSNGKIYLTTATEKHGPCLLFHIHIGNHRKYGKSQVDH